MRRFAVRAMLYHPTLPLPGCYPTPPGKHGLLVQPLTTCVTRTVTLHIRSYHNLHNSLTYSGEPARSTLPGARGTRRATPRNCINRCRTSALPLPPVLLTLLDALFGAEQTFPITTSGASGATHTCHLAGTAAFKPSVMHLQQYDHCAVVAPAAQHCTLYVLPAAREARRTRIPPHALPPRFTRLGLLLHWTCRFIPYLPASA